MSKTKIARLPVQIKLLDADFKSFACPHCGTDSPRYAGAVRHAVDLHLDHPVVLQIQVGCYRCPLCVTKPCFRTPLGFLGRRRKFVTRARQKLVESIEQDGMAIGKAVKRLERDFHVTIAPSTGWEWHRDAAPTSAELCEYEQLVVASFSGVLVVDEVYDGGYAILCARDPLTHRTVAYQLCKEMNGAVVQGFFESLRDIGIHPEALVTDASALYPKALRAVWKNCKHQLCRFHWIKDITTHVVAGIRAYQKSLPAPEKRAKGGRPSNKEAKKQKKAASQQAVRDGVRKGRFLFVTRPENLTDSSQKRLETLVAAHPTLAVIRAFMVEVYGLLDGKPRPAEAKCRWQALTSNTAYQACPHLAGALKKVADEQTFDQVCLYLRYDNLDATSNEVERDNRGFRRRQNAHYRLRSEQSIRVMLDRRLLRDGPPPPKGERLRKRFGRRPLPLFTNQLPEEKTA